jgi:hypothetical protein
MLFAICPILVTLTSNATYANLTICTILANLTSTAILTSKATYATTATTAICTIDAKPTTMAITTIFAISTIGTIKTPVYGHYLAIPCRFILGEFLCGPPVVITIYIVTINQFHCFLL